jgi:putative flavoprotein involved in K+ transport
VLVVGSGQSGCQIAQELHEAGREVVLACGRAPWSPRRVGDRDFVWWLLRTGFLDAPADSLPGPEARLSANVLATGRDGGHDLHLRVLRALGVTLAGRLVGAAGGVARFAPDLADSVAWGDERYLQLRELFRKHGLDADLPDPEPFDGAAPETVDVRGFGAAIFTSGFRPDYASWLRWPEAFDQQGFPLQNDGESTAVPGLFFPRHALPAKAEVLAPARRGRGRRDRRGADRPLRLSGFEQLLPAFEQLLEVLAGGRVCRERLRVPPVVCQPPL